MRLYVCLSVRKFVHLDATYTADLVSDIEQLYVYAASSVLTRLKKKKDTLNVIKVKLCNIVERTELTDFDLP